MIGQSECVWMASARTKMGYQKGANLAALIVSLGRIAQF